MYYLTSSVESEGTHSAWKSRPSRPRSTSASVVVTPVAGAGASRTENAALVSSVVYPGRSSHRHCGQIAGNVREARSGRVPRLDAQSLRAQSDGSRGERPLTTRYSLISRRKANS